MTSKFSFPYVDIWFDVSKSQFDLKTAVENVGWVSVYFWGGHKNILRL